MTTQKSIEALQQRIDELERLNHQLLQEQAQEVTLDFAWAGNLGHWYWDVATNHVTFNPLKVITLGYVREELPSIVPFQFFTNRIHPEDFERTMQAMRDHLYQKQEVYEVEYRIQTRAGDYRWYYDRGKVTKRDAQGKPLFVAGIVFDITHAKTMQQELEEKNRQLAALSRTDELTGVMNHRALMEYLEEHLAKVTNQRPLSLIMLDLDHFKRVNDEFGHLRGDAVLKEFAALIKEQSLDRAVVGRYGGEEFMVIVHGENAQAYELAETLKDAVASHVFDGAIRITLSGGVYEAKRLSLVELVEAADAKMYEAKQGGRNQIR